MCRLMAYMGEPILVAHVVLWPDRSIIKQSYDAKERLSDPALPMHLQHGNLNGDGFGIGWFCDRPDLGAGEAPCVFTSVTPAWNNDNLTRLASKINSSLIFAHVRAAYPGMPVSEQNCHPFQYKRYMWMHNGAIGGFAKLRRPLLSVMSDEAYDAVPSFHSDSAIAFGLFLHFLPHHDRKLSPDILLKAMEQTISTISDYCKKFGVAEVSLLNFVVSDGSTLIATRYVYPANARPASLYYAEGNSFQRVTSLRFDGTSSSPQLMRQSSIRCESNYELTYAEQGSGVALIASEPITGTQSDWVAVPKNHALIISREKSGYVNIMRSPLTDSGVHERQEEVSICLEAIGRGISTTARAWSSKVPPSLSSPTSDPVPIVEAEDDRISGDASAVLCLAVDAIRQRLFASLKNGCICVWDLTNQELIHKWHAHDEPAMEIVLSGEFLYTTGGHRLRVWDLDTYECTYVAQMKPGAGTLRALAVMDEAIYVGGQDACVKLFTLNRMTFSRENLAAENMEWCKRTPMNTGHLSVIQCLEICDRYICSAGGDSVIRVWDAASLSLVAALRGHRGSVLTCKGYGCILLSGGRDNTLRVWDLEALLCRRALSGHKDDVLHIAMLCPGALGMRTVRSRNRNRRSLSIASSGGPCLVASSSADCTIRLWSMSTWACIKIFNLLRVEPSIAISPQASPHASRTKAATIQQVTPLSLALTRSQLYVGTRGGDILMWKIEDVVQSLMKSMEESRRIEARQDDQYGCLQLRDSESCLNLAEFQSMTKAILESELERSLADFIQIKTVNSISSDPLCKEDCFKGAKFLARHLENLGAEVKLVQGQEDKNPVVIGRLGQDPSKPTLTFYGHYDVQPAQEPGWKTDPFTVHARDGYIYARGASDNKGPVLAFIYAVKELVEIQTWDPKAEPLPLNIAFLFEGEEENGSKGTMEAVRQNLHWFHNNILTVVSNTQWVGENVPCLTYGMRGMISLNITVSGPKNDLHSGNDGGVCNEPMVDLVKLLATLVDSHSGICVPGFYDDVATTLLDAAWDSLEASEEFSPFSYQAALGIPGLTVSSSKQEILNARWCKPTLSVVDMRSDGGQAPCDHCDQMDHYRFGPTRFSVIPCVAVGKISIRFVPKQSKEKMISCLRNHVVHEFAKLRSKNRVCVNVLTSGDWWEANTDSKYFNMAKKAILEAWGKSPLTVREGGTMPLASSLEQVLGASALLIPMGQSSDNCHLANERIRKVNLMKGKEVIKNLLEDIITELRT